MSVSNVAPRWSDVAWRRASPFVAFAFLLAVGVGLELSLPAQGRFSHFLVGVVKTALAEPGVDSVLAAGLAVGAWFIHMTLQPLGIYAAFLAVEIVMVGPPRSWAVTFYALVVQVVVTLFFLAAGPVLTRVLPDGWGLAAPLARLTPDQVPAFLSALAPIGLALVSVLVFNLGQYWAHRLQHTIPLLWRFHAVHHSIEDLDSLNSFTHPIDSFGERLLMITIAALIGFEYDTVIWIVALQAMHDRLLHTRAPINAGWFGHVFVDNRYHFMHHSIREEDYNRNFSAWFTLWDHLFGTYKRPPEGPLVRTGVREITPPTTVRQFIMARLDSRPQAPDVGRV